MTKVFVPLLNVTVRRDANTITPTTVPKHELGILRMMFGKENVTETEASTATIEVDTEGEHERLSAKYGAPKVNKVYGDDNGERLAELVQRDAVKPSKATAATADKKPEADK
jgi:hypothetical protein